MQQRITAISASMPGHKLRCASLMLLPALLLAGCGSSPSPNADLEARIAAVEEKAEKAEIRSKEALSMAMSGGSSSGGSAPVQEEFPDEMIPEEEGFGQNPSSGNQLMAPPPQGQVGPQGPPMTPGV